MTTRKRRTIPAPRRRATNTCLASVLPNRFMAWVGLISIIAAIIYMLLRFFGYDPLQNIFIDKSYKIYNGFGIKIPTKFGIHGIDVSSHQGGINWSLVKSMKDDDVSIRFAFIKATEGVVFKDRYFDYNWKNAQKQDLVRGAYHYFKPNSDPIQQAKHFCRTVKLEEGDLPPVLDVEEKSRLTRAELSKRVQAWLNEVEQTTGVRPILYTGKDFYEKNLCDWLDKDYPLWLAHYYVSMPKLENDDRWIFWQHNNKGRVDGIAEKVDFNVFYGKEKALEGMRVK